MCLTKINNVSKVCAFLMAIVLVGSFSSMLHASSYTKTKYPIVLVHGLTGFDSVGSLLDYFHNVSWNLERSGAKVYTAQVSFVHNSEERGVQLKNYIVNNIPEAKVNIFAHSQGAPTARVTATFIPDRIASITSISGANKGSKVADVLRGVIPPDGLIEGGIAALAEAFGSLMNLLTHANHPQDAVAALETLTTAGSADLNTRHGWGVNTASYCGTGSENVNVYGNNIKMFSWVGTDVFTNILDATDPFLILASGAFGSEESDGLVSKCSQYMGNIVYNNQRMNHIDTVNHLFGITSIWHNPISVYREHANRLKNRGI